MDPFVKSTFVISTNLFAINQKNTNRSTDGPLNGHQLRARNIFKCKLAPYHPQSQPPLELCVLRVI